VKIDKLEAVEDMNGFKSVIMHITIRKRKLLWIKKYILGKRSCLPFRNFG